MAIFKKKIRFMCNKCFELTNEITVTTLIESYDTSLSSLKLESKMNCKHCNAHKRNLICLDSKIAPAISKLNKLGLRTNFCCEGHSDNSYKAYISFDNDININIFRNLPISWFFDMSSFKKDGSKIIRTDNLGKELKIKELDEWIDSLSSI